MAPRRRLRKRNATVRQVFQVPVRLVPITSCHSSGAISTSGRSRVMPALLTSAVSGPRCCSAAETNSSTAVGSVTSHGPNQAPTPYASTSARVLSAASLGAL
ncbi:hypothetical protein GCM10027614_09370 [Micromonospora vulcania]